MNFDHQNGDEDAAKFLEKRGFRIEHGCIYHPDGRKHVETKNECKAIDWLCVEYDYCFEFGKPVVNSLFR